MNTISMTLILLASLSAFSAEVTIVQKDKKFDKTAIDIKAGDKIVFKNDEASITHNVYSLGPKNAFELKTQAPGSSSTVEFKEKGTTEVECAIHTNMKLKVNVK